MTVSNNQSNVSHLGNGLTAEFPVNFQFLEQTDLIVVKVFNNGQEETLSLGEDYSVQGGNGSFGTVTFVVPPLGGERIHIRRSTALTQNTDYQEGEAFPANTHERAIDRLTMQNQEQAETLSRALRFPPTDESGINPFLPAPEAGKTIIWNEAADALENSEYPLDQAVALVNAGESQALLARDAAKAAQVAGEAARDIALAQVPLVQAEGVAQVQAVQDEAALHLPLLKDEADRAEAAAAAAQAIADFDPALYRLNADPIQTADMADGAITQAKIDPAVMLGGPSLGVNSIIRTNADVIAEDITIPAGVNGMSAGPITIADGFTLTVNGNYVVV